jgi:hypothetical protein
MPSSSQSNDINVLINKICLLAAPVIHHYVGKLYHDRRQNSHVAIGAATFCSLRWLHYWSCQEARKYENGVKKTFMHFNKCDYTVYN